MSISYENKRYLSKYKHISMYERVGKRLKIIVLDGKI